MPINPKKINSLLNILALITVIGGGIWTIFLNDAQRIVVVAGIVLALINLLGLRYFFNRNIK